MIIEYNKDNPVVLGEIPVLLDFYATWCGPCRMTSNNLYKFMDAHPEFTVYSINVDENPEITEQYGVQSLPTLIYVNSKGELWRHNGLMTVKMLEEKINDRTRVN